MTYPSKGAAPICLPVLLGEPDQGAGGHLGRVNFLALVHQHATGNVDEGNISRAALNIAPEPSITDIRCNSFTVRTLSKWNSLPKSVQVSKSVVKVNYDNFIWALR